MRMHKNRDTRRRHTPHRLVAIGRSRPCHALQRVPLSIRAAHTPRKRDAFTAGCKGRSDDRTLSLPRPGLAMVCVSVGRWVKSHVTHDVFGSFCGDRLPAIRSRHTLHAMSTRQCSGPSRSACVRPCRLRAYPHAHTWGVGASRSACLLALVSQAKSSTLYSLASLT